MQEVLLDVNIVLDLFLNRTPYANAANILINLSQDKKIRALVTPVVIANTYYSAKQLLIRSKMPTGIELSNREREAINLDAHKTVIESIKQLLTVVDVLAMNKNAILLAASSRFKDFEDALHNFAAESYGNIDVIITRDSKDFRASKIAIMTADEYISSRD